MAKVLLADDEEALRLLLGRQLRRGGHDVTVAEDGQAAAELLNKEIFDVIVSDMKMPRLDGMGLLAYAAKIAPGTEFIILTGHGNMENAVQAFKMGNLFDYLLKPLNDIRELDGVVARAAERRHLRTENYRLVNELQERITELEEAKGRLSALAERDGLTGLLNHRTLHARLQASLLDAHMTSLAVIMLDMDSFKRLNDTYGHPVGDQILRYVAHMLQETCAPECQIGRCGGDEFTILCPGINEQEAAALAWRIRDNMSNRPFINPEGTPLPIRMCFGIADIETVGRSSLELITAADSALYTSKRAGGDMVTSHNQPGFSDEAMGASGTAYSVLEGLVTAIDHKDHYTKVHSEHMTQFALALTEALGCSDETYNVIRVAGLLHDIGKIGVPDSILCKPGKLSQGEYEVMKTHVTLSAAIIHGLPHLSDILEAVAHHHERWDGKGYPNGLAGETIPLLGRIMAIADAFSAMTLDRPYRSGMTVEAALVEIERGAGQQFDPQLAPVFVRTVRLQEDEKAAAAEDAPEKNTLKRAA